MTQAKFESHKEGMPPKEKKKISVCSKASSLEALQVLLKCWSIIRCGR